MARRKYHIPLLASRLSNYAETRTLDFHQYSKYHMRIMDGGYTVLDIWTTGRYYVLTTDYSEMGIEVIERGGEKGNIPENMLDEFLDHLFFPEVAQ